MPELTWGVPTRGGSQAVDGLGNMLWTCPNGHPDFPGWFARAELQTSLGIVRLAPWTLHATEPEARVAAEGLLAELRRRFSDA